MDELSEIVPCGILLFDDGGKILKANGTLSRLLRYERGELEGKSVDVILTVASRIFYDTHFFALIKLNSRADEIFLTLTSKTKELVPVLANAVRRTTVAGEQNIVVLMPVVERAKFETEILEAKRVAENALTENRELQRIAESLEAHAQALEKQNQKMLAINKDLMQFNKVISHDLQEPIRKIRLFAGMLLQPDEKLSPERVNGAVAKIEKSAERLSELTLGLQEYIHLEDDIHTKMVNLNDSLTAAAARVKKVRNFDELHLSFEPLPTIEGYPGQLELLFYHLIDNAIQFRNPDRPLKIAVNHTLIEENLYRSLPDRYKFIEFIKIVFSDNGIGFDDQFKDRIFELGNRLQAGSDGIGIGLALIRKIVTNHGGTISIRSETAKGTEIVFLLPVRYSASLSDSR